MILWKWIFYKKKTWAQSLFYRYRFSLLNKLIYLNLNIKKYKCIGIKKNINRFPFHF